MQETVLNKKNRKIKKTNIVPEVKDYEKMYNDNEGVFYLLNKAKQNYDLIHTHKNARPLIEFALKQLGYNSKNTQEKLRKIDDINTYNYDQLVAIINDVYSYNFEVENNKLVDLIKDVITKVEEKDEALKSEENLYTARDFIALMQVERNKYFELTNKDLLTVEQFNSRGFDVAKDAVSVGFNSEGEPLYDWASAVSNIPNNLLSMPIKNGYYQDYTIKKDDEFEGYWKFLKYVRDEGYKVDADYKTVLPEQPIIIDKKNIIIGDNDLNKIEQSVLLMYELNKQTLQKEGLVTTKSAKSIKNFLSKKGSSYIDYPDVIKDFKYDKDNLEEFIPVINDVIATLSTINMARIYMDAKTFKKVECYLNTQASMKLAKLPRLTSTWVMPYITDKVLQASKFNFYNAGLDINDIINIYKKTGNDVEYATNINDIILSKNTNNPNRTTTKGKNKLDKNTTNNKNSNERCKYATFSLKRFLQRNLTMEEPFSKTKTMTNSSQTIVKANKEGVDMKAVSNKIYEIMLEDVENNTKHYERKKDNKIYIDGWFLFKKYFESIKVKENKDKYFQKMLKDAIKEQKELKESKNQKAEEAEKTY